MQWFCWIHELSLFLCFCRCFYRHARFPRYQPPSGQGSPARRRGTSRHCSSHCHSRWPKRYLLTSLLILSCLPLPFSTYWFSLSFTFWHYGKKQNKTELCFCNWRLLQHPSFSALMFSGFVIDAVAWDSLQIIHISMKLLCPKIDSVFCETDLICFTDYSLVTTLLCGGFLFCNSTVLLSGAASATFWSLHLYQ